MSSLNFKLSWVEHVKSFIILGPDVKILKECEVWMEKIFLNTFSEHPQ